MNVNQKFLDEAKLLEGRWNKAGLLDGLKDYSRATTAVLLEWQRLMNEQESPAELKTHLAEHHQFEAPDHLTAKELKELHERMHNE